MHPSNRLHVGYRGLERDLLTLHIGGMCVHEALMVRMPGRRPFIGLLILPGPQLSLRDIFVHIIMPLPHITGATNC